MKRFIKTNCVIFAIFIFFTGCDKTLSSLPSRLKKEERANPVTLYLPTLPKTLDPRKMQSLADQTFISMVMEGLTRIDQTGNSPFALAEKVAISLDEKTYTFTLRKSKWSNGDPVTSYDFAHAWKKSLSPDFDASNAQALYVIKNAQEAKGGKLPLSLVGIETPDEQTLVVILNSPTPSFLTDLSHPIFFPVNRKVDKTNPKWAEAPITYVGNGPFLFHARETQDRLEVKKNPNYWDEKAVKLTEIEMLPAHLKPEFERSSSQTLYPNMTQAKQPVKSLKTTNDEKRHRFPSEWILVNAEKSPLENKNFRKALASVIVLEETPDPLTQTVSTPAQSSIQTELNQTPIDRTETFLNEALSELGLSSKQCVTLSLLYPSDQIQNFLAQRLQNQWKNCLGIEVQLNGVEKQEFLDRLSKNDYSLSLGDWSTEFTGSPFQSQLDYENLWPSTLFFIPISYFTLFDEKDKTLKGLVLTTAGHIDFKWAYLN